MAAANQPYSTSSPQTAISATTTRAQLPSLGSREVWISNSPSSAGIIYVGDVTVTSTGGGKVHGFVAVGGVMVVQVSNPNLFYIVAASTATVFVGVLD